METGRRSLPFEIGKRTFALFDGETEAGTLGSLCGRLLDQQKKTWARLGDAYDALQDAKVRRVACTGFTVRLQHNRNRITSITAAVGEKEIKARPCFLCPRNLPDEQHCILWRNRYLILCNPMPVVPLHLTLAHAGHRRQSAIDNIDDLLLFSSDFGDGWVILYNGPACGASAPDHLHFQAIPAGNLPVEDEVRRKENADSATKGPIRLFRPKNLGREIMVIEGDGGDGKLAGALRDCIASLKRGYEEAEPMVNIVVERDGGQARFLVFPRLKHRPDAFFCNDDRQVMVSPAVMEMAGLIVTAAERDFERLRAGDIEALYREVSLFLPG